MVQRVPGCSLDDTADAVCPPTAIYSNPLAFPRLCLMKGRKTQIAAHATCFFFFLSGSAVSFTAIRECLADEQPRC